MLLQTTPSAEPVAAVRVRRHKGRKRRLKRDLRLLAPLFALVGESLLLAAAIVFVERSFVVSDASDSDYGVTTISISSTSNVSTAPPGILPGEPLSP